MDSLQLVEYFTKYVEDLKEKDQEEKNNPNTNPVNFNNNQNSGGKWYFTSSAALTLGSNEFKKVWGQRKLEDDWRRQNKASGFLVDNPVDTGNTNAIDPRYDINTYISQVPKGEEAILASNEMIYKALYELGSIYKEKILDFPKSVEAYEELETRCPKNHIDYFPVVYFQLYNLYKAMNKEEQMNKNKDIILTKYPNSDYAAIILDPEAFAAKNESNDAASPAYTAAYNMYKGGDYMGSLNASKNALAEFSKSALAHRFSLLKALNIDKISGRDSFRVALHEVVEKYKGTESAGTAQRLLDAIEGKKTDNPEVNIKAEFIYDAKAEHFVIIYIPDASVKVTSGVGKLNEFNDIEYENKEFSISNTILPQSGQVILIRKFTSGADAMEYVNRYEEKNMPINIKLNTPSKIMAISAPNFAMLIKTPSMAEYQNFYTANYSK
jgi:hypothetical protein